mmetsp:Transcript_58133/g.104019  ORF Transcript_58133/g.104019 Transcript_58133/m.104019 type:complete len:257 (-) Transcript_58133:30-800(-)
MGDGPASPAKQPARRRPASAGARPSSVKRRPSSAGAQCNLNKVAGLGAAPKWTLLGRREHHLRPPQTPGPGQYELASPEQYWCNRRPPSYSMRKPLRGRSSSVPGPGEYEMELEAKGPKWGFSNRTEEAHPNVKPKHSPGPGHYKLGSTLVNKKRSMSAPVLGPRRPQTPGPGAYSPNEKLVKRVSSPGWSNCFRGGRNTPPRASKYADKTAPGDYDPGRRCAHEFHSKPRWSLGMKREKKINVSDVAGCTYTQFM